MSDNYPPGCSDLSIARAAGELATCDSCGREFSLLHSNDSETCPACRRGEDDRPVEEPRERE